MLIQAPITLIRKYLLFLLLCINSLYVYGGSIIRMGVLIINVLLTLMMYLIKSFHKKEIIRFDKISIFIFLLLMASLFFSFLNGIINWGAVLAVKEAGSVIIVIIIYSILFLVPISREEMDDILFSTILIIGVYNISRIIFNIYNFNLNFAFLPEFDLVVFNNRISFYSPSFQMLAFFLPYSLIVFLEKRKIKWLINLILCSMQLLLNYSSL